MIAARAGPATPTASTSSSAAAIAKRLIVASVAFGEFKSA
jgi:hypothetical protein